LQEVLAGRGELEGGPESTMDPGLVNELREIGRRARRELLGHQSALAEVDRTLPVLTRRTADQVGKSFGKLCDKVSRVQANRSGKGRKHLRRLNQSLCPRGEAQERVFGAFPFIARYGRGWIDELLGELDAVASEHVLVHLGLGEAASP
jgi:hypothetical protein